MQSVLYRVRHNIDILRKVLYSITVSCVYYWRIEPLKQADILLVCHDNSRGDSVDGKPYAHIVDNVAFFAHRLGYSTLTVAKPYSHLIGPRAYGHPRSINLQSLFLVLLSYITLGFRREDLIISMKIRMWSKLLSKIRPKVVIGTQPTKELCAACNLSGIAVYDVQHGVINEQHPWYGSRLKSLNLKFLPKGFLVWDDSSVRALSYAEKRGLQIIPIGHPAFLRYGSCQTTKQPENSTSAGDHLTHILITLQWGLADVLSDPEERGLLCLGLIEAIKNAPENIRWHIRMHPVQVRQDYSRTCSDLRSMLVGVTGVDINHATQISLPKLLSQIDLHITYHSTVVVEAGWLGVPSAILCPFVRSGKYSSYYKKERDSGIAECIACDKEDILSWIDKKRGGKKKKYILTNSLNDFLKKGVEGRL